MKRLKDYPSGEWMEAADGCDLCGAKYEVRVDWVDESGDLGDVTYRITHGEDCPEMYESEKDTETSDFSGWEFSHRVLEIVGREWPTLKSRANIGPCVNCWKLVIGAPLILWPSDHEVQVDFCFECARKLGILDLLLKQRDQPKWLKQAIAEEPS